MHEASEVNLDFLKSEVQAKDEYITYLEKKMINQDL